MKIEKITLEGELEAKGRNKTRFTPEEKLFLLSQINKETTTEEVAEKYNLAVGTLKNWGERKGKATCGDDPLGLKGLADRSTKPKRFGNVLSKETQERILGLWQENPGLGPSQLHYQLKREGVKVSTKAIRKLLIANGYQKKEKVGVGALNRFEAERPNASWQMDIVEFYLGKQKMYLMLLLDDFSRFLTGFGLFTEATMSNAISVFRKAANRYGKPDSLLTDRGMQFHSWRTLSRFEKVLEALGVEHILARPHHPQTVGKVEALNKRVQNEFLSKNHFSSQSQLEEGLHKWLYDYNFSRTHQGIRDPELGNVLTPADRYFGRVDEVLAKVRARLSGEKVDSLDYTTEIEKFTPFEILKVIENTGNLEIWFAGRRVPLS